METKTALKEILKKHFGFEDFRPGQEQAIQTLLEHKRVLCIQPTGYGKSLLYQLPALLLEGVTLVISPLLALMRDQLDHLTHRFSIPAGSINTDQDLTENERTKNLARSGRLRILFISPEQLDNLDTYDFLQELPITLLVVDEAHCISTWGHDFRPSYRQIVRAVHEIEQTHPNLHVLGLTATANHRTEEDIAQQLRAPNSPPLKVLRSEMDRPNISLALCPVQGVSEKLGVLAQMLPELEGSGILYCATREQTEVVAEYLSGRGLDVVSYHAGYDPARKRELQYRFINGEHKAIAATNALGMGIDKPDIRFIVHVDVPGSITAYYQEVGRSGRDGLPATGLLLYDQADRKIQDHFIRSAQPTQSDFDVVLSQLTPNAQGMWPNLAIIKSRTGLHPTRVTVIMAELMEQGHVEKVKMKGKQVYVRTGKSQEPDLTRYTRQHQVRTGELNAMLNYGMGREPCLMQALRKALGDDNAQACGRCSQCNPENWFHLPDPSSDHSSQDWLTKRDVPIPSSRIPVMSEGRALLNSDLKSSLFVQFMKQRAPGKDGQVFEKLPQRLTALARAKIQDFKPMDFSAILAVPSNTWMQRAAVMQMASEILQAPAFGDFLFWDPPPEHRQGELMNNDQRKENVKGKMRLSQSVGILGQGPILLLDDYVGSSNTLKEAVRALRKDGGFKGDVIPLTMARVKWRLGARGMI